VSSQDSAPSEDVLVDLFQRFGCSLPPDFLSHATNRYGGLYIEVKEEFWPRPKEFDVGPFWTFLYGLYTFNIANGIPEFMDLVIAAEGFEKDTGHQAIPFLKVISDADVYCFDKQGAVVRWNHETNDLEFANKSFYEVLDYELGELADRKNRKVAMKNA
jgi:hypothetical protein